MAPPVPPRQVQQSYRSSCSSFSPSYSPYGSSTYGGYSPYSYSYGGGYGGGYSLGGYRHLTLKTPPQQTLTGRARRTTTWWPEQNMTLQLLLRRSFLCELERCSTSLLKSYSPVCVAGQCGR